MSAKTADELFMTPRDTLTLEEKRRLEEIRYQRIKQAGKTKPETLREARTWENVKNHYLSAGLCHQCAEQAAWGHQNGFSTLWPPCSQCLSLIEKFPRSTSEGSLWRRFQRGRDARALGA